MKIKSLLSLITLGVGVGALGLTSVVSSNAVDGNIAEVVAAEEASTARYIYVGTDIYDNGFKLSGSTHLYAWKEENGTDTPTLGNWPGTTFASLYETGKVSVTNLTNFYGTGGIYKIDVTALNGANKFKIADNNGHESSNMYFDSNWETYHYYSSKFNTSSYGTIDGNADFYAAAALAFDLDKEVTSTTEVKPESANNYHSVCNLTDAAKMKDLLDRYDSLVGLGKGLFDNSTYWTYGSGEGSGSQNADVNLGSIMNQVRNLYAYKTNPIMFVGRNPINPATYVIAAVSTTTIIASVGLLIARNKKNKKA
ncbi:MAG: hypothetical protein SO007_07825 [Candidatus Enteromonas sp.]|nr:hypothetical protein [Candidatus Enteromonas sp.]